MQDITRHVPNGRHPLMRRDFHTNCSFWRRSAGDGATLTISNILTSCRAEVWVPVPVPRMTSSGIALPNLTNTTRCNEQVYIIDMFSLNDRVERAAVTSRSPQPMGEPYERAIARFYLASSRTVRATTRHLVALYRPIIDGKCNAETNEL